MQIDNYIPFYTLFKKEVDRFLKIYVQTILSPLLTNILFLWVFWWMFKTRSIWIEWVDYLSFLVPWLCAMWAITSSFQTPSFSLIISKFQNTIQDLNSYPISSFGKSMAYILAWSFRGFLVWFLTYISTIVFVWYSIDNWILFFVWIFLISFIFSCLWYILWLYLKDFDKINFALSIVITPLIYFWWVFFEITKLPWIFSKIAFLNPIFPLVDFLRFSYIWKSEWVVLFDVWYILLITFLFYWVAYYMTKRGVWVKD